MKEELKAIKDLQGEHIKKLAANFEGVRVMQDPLGMICSPNEYVIICGEKLFKLLRGEGKEVEE